MALEIAPCSDADIPRAFAIMSDAFGTIEPFINGIYPEHTTPAGRAVGAERLLAVKKSDPFAHFLKVTDPLTGAMMAFAEWIVVDGREGGAKPPESELEGDYWDTQDAKEYAQHMFTTYFIIRRTALREAKGPILCLNLLVVDPKYQKRGAGTLLVQWGTDLADKLGAEAVVEASLAGRRVYQKFGFVLNEKVTVAVPEKWEHLPKQSFLWMRRPVTISAAGQTTDTF